MADLISHEVQFFSRMDHHIQVHGSGLREFLFVLSVHFLQDRRFAMHHLVVGIRQQVSFIPEIHHGESQFVILLCPVFRIALKIFQRVMHPSQIPLVIKTQPPFFCFQSDVRKIGRILRRQDAAGMQTFQTAIHIFQK